MSAPKRKGAGKPAAPSKKTPPQRPVAAPATSEPRQAPRGPLMARLHKALRSSYKPVPSATDRPLLEQVLYACCLENAPADVADRAFARLQERAFDLNEVRVTTVAELAETLHDLPDPSRAALSLRRALQSTFESTYSFSLEHARKHSLAHGIKTLEHLHGVPSFVVQHVVATGLGGHVIPLDRAALSALYLTGIVSREEYDSGRVTGLERCIPKKSVVEFNSLLHQFGIECLRNLHGATVKRIVQAVNPAAKDRFPKRGEPLPVPTPPPTPTTREGQRAAEAARSAAEESRPAGPQAAARPAGKTPMPPPGSGPKRPGDDKKGTGAKSGPKPFVVKPNVGKPITIKPQTAPPAAARPPARPAAAQQPSSPPKKPAGKPARPAPKSAAASKQHSKQLAKRKPR